MTKYRSAALVVAACAAGLSAAACSAGNSTSSSAAASGSASPSSSASAIPVTSSAAPTSGPAIASKDLGIKGATIATFPVPSGAKVAENEVAGKSIVIVFGSIQPADVARFYGSALPKAGYSVSSNSMLSRGSDHGAYVEFTGHGYKGTIDSLDQFPGMSVAGIGDKNVTTIIFAKTS